MDRATKATSISEIKGRFDKMTSAVFLDQGDDGRGSQRIPAKRRGYRVVRTRS
jgi:hypothetical protein